MVLYPAIVARRQLHNLIAIACQHTCHLLAATTTLAIYCDSPILGQTLEVGEKCRTLHIEILVSALNRAFGVLLGGAHIYKIDIIVLNKLLERLHAERQELHLALACMAARRESQRSEQQQK